ncbi:MAG TPA: trehalase family glycosidase [Candidatus Saccharibacteria bacterium]|nr:trehalase family glycosidase [Candidatus Saccharibacteria bacterium]
MNKIWHKKPPHMHNANVEATLAYIDQHWADLLYKNTQDTGTLIGLPHDYIVPAAQANAQFNFEEQYYWDTYFILLGLNDQKYSQLAKGMLENLVALYKRFHMIPNASRLYFLSRSQPPLLTSMILLYKETFGCSGEWFDEMMAIAEDEYTTVWMSTKHPHWRKIGQLNRYYDINALHDLAEAESGWDMTPRFDRKCLDYYPIDLNSLLYKYEKDFADWYRTKNDLKTAALWDNKAQKRAQIVDELLWGHVRKFYFDYNFEDEKRGLTWSLAGFYPMWVGMVDDKKAKELVKQLGKFEKDGGLSTTSRPMINLSLLFGSVKTQWAYPNGWAPLQWIVIKGLERYGYTEDANRLAKKWLKTCTDWYATHGVLLEKYNVVTPTREPIKGVYPSQTGFGWTNGIYVALARDYA